MRPYTDTERLDRLEQMLHRSGDMHEFWFDDDAKIFFAGEQMGDNLRGAIDNLIDAPVPEPVGGAR